MPETQPTTLHLGGKDSPRNDKFRRIARLDERYDAEWTPPGDILDDLLNERLTELGNDRDSGEHK